MKNLRQKAIETLATTTTTTTTPTPTTTVDDLISDYILGIVKRRGKMHNPETDSGGVLVGKVKKLGEALLIPGAFRLSVGDLIVPLCSLTAIPLKLDRILGVHGDQVQVEGEAVIFSRYAYAPLPQDFSLSLSLAAIDVSRLLPQVERYVKQGDCVLVVGCGKAGLTAISAVRRCFPSSRILAVDVNEQQLQWARKVLLASDAFVSTSQPHIVEKVSATDARALSEFVFRNTEGGRGADIVLSCVNVPNAEAGCVISTRQGGMVVFFSMATNFSRACLSTDGTGKDVTLLIGGGVFHDAAERIYDLLRQDSALRSIFAELHP